MSLAPCAGETTGIRGRPKKPGATRDVMFLAILEWLISRSANVERRGGEATRGTSAWLRRMLASVDLWGNEAPKVDAFHLRAAQLAGSAWCPSDLAHVR